MTDPTTPTLPCDEAGELAALVQSQWPGRSWTAEPLDGGMTNRNWKVTLSGTEDSFAVQLLLPDETAAGFGIDRDTQAKVMRVVGALELAPRVIAWHRKDPSAIITEFVTSRSAASGNERLQLVKSTAEALALLHTSTLGANLPAPVSDAFVGAEWFYRKALHEMPGTAAEFAWAMEVNRKCAAARGPYVTCLLHSDLSIGNVLPRTGGVSFIDWEYSGSGDRYFDCADFVEKWDLTLDEEQVFLDRYRRGEDREFLAAVVYMYRFHSRLREGLWAASASRAHFIDFDHRSYAQECLRRLKAIADDDRFTRCLDVVAAAKEGQYSPHARH